jgi:hypothetical protein
MGGGVMAVGTRLMALGLGMSEIQNVARELFRFGRDKIERIRWAKSFQGHQASASSRKAYLF